MKWLVSLMFMSVTVSCAHKDIRPPNGDGLYPFGKYQHQVKVNVLTPVLRLIEMQGVVAYSKEALHMVGLSTFGTTVFKIDEDFKTGELKKEFYLEIMRQHPEQFMEFYSMIRSLMLQKKGQTQFRERGAEFSLSEPDPEGIYRHIEITHPNVQIEIQVRDYDLY
jgi:hypothetical protein